MKPSIGNLRSMQEKMGKQISTEDTLSFDEIKYVAGFDVKFKGDKAIVGAAVFDFKTLELKESKFLVTKAPINYIPGMLAFREGPLMMQLYYDLEYEPDIILVDGEGLTHPTKAGLANFVGIELAKPVIGVSKNPAKEVETKEDQILRDGELIGMQVKTKEFANPVSVSPGNLISVKTSADIVKKLVQPPHKMPEPLHVARRIASKVFKEN